MKKGTQAAGDKYEIILRSIGDAVIGTDAEGRVELLNPAAEFLTGWTGEEARGRMLGEVFHIINEETREPVENPVARVLREGVVIGLANHTLLISRDGTERAIADSGAPIFDEAGRIKGVVLVFRDQTAERQAERAMAEARAFAESIVATVREPLVVLNAALEVVSGSPAFYRLFSVTPEETLHRHLYELGNGQWNIPELRRLLEDLLPQNSAVTDYEVIHDFETLGQRTMLLNARRLHRPDGPEEFILLAIEDVTARKQAEEKLSRSAAEWEQIFNASNDVIWLVDDGHRIRRTNRRAEDFFQMRAEEMIGRYCWEIVHGRTEPIPECPLRRASRSHEREKLVMEERGLWFEVTADPIVDQAARLVGTVHIMNDITAYRQAQEEKENLRSQLAQAQKMESIGRLASGVAHDFNNQLTVIMSDVEMAMQQLSPLDPRYEPLADALKAAHRSADLTRQLLAFARKETISPRTLDLNVTVSGLMKMLHRLIGEHINLLWVPGPDLWPAWMDPAQIDQILVNLLVNARDAISGPGKITIETGNVIIDRAYCERRVFFVPGEYVLLAVSDNGAGMSPEVLTRIFEPFFTTKETGKGTGLGMAVVYGIVKQNGGFINVYSEVGRGTTVKIYLPRAREGEQTWPEEKKEQFSLPYGRGELILVVEDDPDVRAVNQRMLEELGYRVITAATPGEALRLVQERGREISLLLADVVLPEMDGRKLAEKIAALCPGIRCLYLSGYTANVIAHHGVLEAGIQFLPKPFTMEKLALKLRELLE